MCVSGRGVWEHTADISSALMWDCAWRSRVLVVEEGKGG